MLTTSTILDQDMVIDNQRSLGNEEQATKNVQGEIAILNQVKSRISSAIEEQNEKARKWAEKFAVISPSKNFKSRTCVEPLISLQNSRVSYEHRP